MKKYLLATNNAQKLKDLEPKAKEAGTRAVAVSSSGSLYLWGDGKPVKTNSDEVASILGVEVEEVIKWIESKGRYEMIDQVVVEPVVESHLADEIEENLELTINEDISEEDEDDRDYDESVHDELIYQLLGELVEVQKNASIKIEQILDVLEKNILA